MPISLVHILTWYFFTVGCCCKFRPQTGYDLQIQIDRTVPCNSAEIAPQWAVPTCLSYFRESKKISFNSTNLSLFLHVFKLFLLGVICSTRKWCLFHHRRSIEKNQIKNWPLPILMWNLFSLILNSSSIPTSIVVSSKPSFVKRLMSQSLSKALLKSRKRVYTGNWSWSQNYQR